MKKILLIIAVVLLVFIIAVVVVAAAYLGPIVKVGIENIGPPMTKVPVTVDAVSVSPLAGSLQVKGLVVGNPPGYNTLYAISVGTVSVKVDPWSLLSKKVIIHSIRLVSPQITFEGGLLGNNLGRILSNVNAASRNPSSSAQAPVHPGSKPAANVEIDDFLVTGAKVHVSPTGLGGRELTLPLPDIHLTDLGKNGAGLTPVEMTRIILGAITADTVKSVSSSIADLKNGVRTLEGSFDKGAGKGFNAITNTIGNLLGK